MKRNLNLQAILIVFLTIVVSSRLAHAQWTSPKPINNDMSWAQRLQNVSKIATDEAGNTLVSWISETRDYEDQSQPYMQLMVARSTSGGNQYGGGMVVKSSSKNILWHDIAYAGNGVWVLISNEYDDAENRLFVCRRSSDFGKTWSPAQEIITDFRRAYWYPDYELVSDGYGVLLVTIEDRVYRSADYGNSWAITDSIDESNGYDPVAISHFATDASGHWLHCFKTTYTGPDKLFVRASYDGGLSWVDKFQSDIDPGSQLDLATSSGTTIIAISENGTGENQDEVDNDRKLLILKNEQPDGDWTSSTLDTDGRNCWSIRLVANDSKWMLLANQTRDPYRHSPSYVISYECNDGTNWKRTDNLQVLLSDLCRLSSGGFSLTGWVHPFNYYPMIYVATYNNPVEETTDYNLEATPGTVAKVKTNKKTGESKVSFKVNVANLGPEISENTLMLVLAKDTRETPEFSRPRLIGVIPVKKMAAPKSGKPAKFKKINVKAFVPDYIFLPKTVIVTDILQGYGEEENSDENTVQTQIMQ